MNTKYYKNLRAKSNHKFTSPQNGQKYPANSQNTLTKEQTQPSATSPASPKHRAQVNNKNRNNNKELPATQTKTIIEGEIIQSRESSLTGNSVEKQQLLHLQINQLKRQNQFLRKKIQQLTNELDKECPKKKKTPIAKGNQGQAIIPSIQLSVNYFFKEISTLLNSVAKLFNILKDGERIDQAHYIPDIQNMQCPIEREYLFNKQVLNKKLQRIALESQQQKYTSLLDIFEEYYRYKEEAQLKITDSLDQMIQKTNQLNKQLLEKAQIKKIKSQIYSVSQKEGVSTPNKLSQNLLKTPEITTNIRLTFSPLSKNTQPNRKVSNSPH